MEEPGSRGYGERKHDEYASDVEAADALAEADIYIAYGRHPQAIDLLNNALNNEPGNPVYRLKLLEIYAELKDDAAAQEQLQQLRSIGDEDAIANAEAILAGGAGAVARASAAEPEGANFVDESSDPGLPPNPLQMLDANEQSLESDFAGLDIEGDPLGKMEADELDLSADFKDDSVIEDDEEELVIAAESSGLSTKLDLARAYMDMGDDDGARQILDEVIAEGSADLQAEARALLDRIG